MYEKSRDGAPGQAGGLGVLFRYYLKIPWGRAAKVNLDAPGLKLYKYSYYKT